MSANGVIHVIDKVFLPSSHQTYSTFEEKSYEITHPANSGSSWSIRNSTRKTVHWVTVNENQGRRDYDQALPAYPQGSVIVGSVGRKPEHVFPPAKGKTTRRRGSHKRNRAFSKKTLIARPRTTPKHVTPSTTNTPITIRTTTASTTTPSTTPLTTTSSTTTTTTTSTTTFTVPELAFTTTNRPCTTRFPKLWSPVELTKTKVEHESTLHEARERKPEVVRVIQDNDVSVKYEQPNSKKSEFYDYSLNRSTNEKSEDRKYDVHRSSHKHDEGKGSYQRHKLNSINHEYEKHFPEGTRFDNNRQIISSQYNMSYYSNRSSNYNFSNPVLTGSGPKLIKYYNVDWNVPVPLPINTTTVYRYTKNTTNTTHTRFSPFSPINISTLDGSSSDPYLQKSKVYSYKTYSTKRIDPTLHGSHFNTYNYSNIKTPGERRVHTVSPDGGSYNYVGHPYGSDVVGEDSETPLPFSASGSSYVHRNSTNMDEVMRPRPVFIGRGEGGSNGNRGVSNTMGVTRTFHSQPSRSTSYSKKTSRTYSIPMNRTPVPSVGLDGKLRTDLYSPYAFTDEGRDFADGAEFSEMRVPSEKVITIEQAKILRRQWRRKRRHLRKRNKHRKGRKRGRRNFQKQNVAKENQ